MSQTGTNDIASARAPTAREACNTAVNDNLCWWASYCQPTAATKRTSFWLRLLLSTVGLLSRNYWLLTCVTRQRSYLNVSPPNDAVISAASSWFASAFISHVYSPAARREIIYKWNNIASREIVFLLCSSCESLEWLNCHRNLLKSQTVNSFKSLTRLDITQPISLWTHSPRNPTAAWPWNDLSMRCTVADPVVQSHQVR